MVLDRLGQVIGEGFHRGAGSGHAEVEALADARSRGEGVVGATAIVTMEPCRHTGRTGPCVDALTEAGVARVVYAVRDPGPESGGGGEVLRLRGIEAIHEPSPKADNLVRWFVHSIKQGRPYVICKVGVTLDGRTAAADGTSRWVTGEKAREQAHRVRSQADAIIVGTGTVLVDDPALTARPGGRKARHQPLKVVVGNRDTAGKRAWEGGNAVQIKTHDPAVVLAELNDREVRMAILEGGAVLTTAFLREGLVDEVHAYVAPAFLGSGPTAVGDLGIGTIGEALRLEDVSTSRLGDDVFVKGRPSRKGR